MVALPQFVWEALRMHSPQTQESARRSSLRCQGSSCGLGTDSFAGSAGPGTPKCSAGPVLKRQRLRVALEILNRVLVGGDDRHEHTKLVFQRNSRRSRLVSVESNASTCVR